LLSAGRWLSPRPQEAKTTALLGPSRVVALGTHGSDTWGERVRDIVKDAEKRESWAGHGGSHL
jgi:hypothetical protein